MGSTGRSVLFCPSMNDFHTFTLKEWQIQICLLRVLMGIMLFRVVCTGQGGQTWNTVRFVSGENSLSLSMGLFAGYERQRTSPSQFL